jgi:hypothetical protein
VEKLCEFDNDELIELQRDVHNHVRNLWGETEVEPIAALPGKIHVETTSAVFLQRCTEIVAGVPGMLEGTTFTTR